MPIGLGKYKRVGQRLKEKFRDGSFEFKDLEVAIWKECGTDPRTVKVAIERLCRLDLIEKIPPPREFGIAPVEKYKLKKTDNIYY